jgi:hypothetical protein
MRRFQPAALWATLALLASSSFEVSLAGATDTPEKTVPQGQDPPGADNGHQPMPPLAPRKGVIPPPPTGDEEIHTQAPNPDAGHEEEVIPPPGTPGGDPNVEPR